MKKLEVGQVVALNPHNSQYGLGSSQLVKAVVIEVNPRCRETSRYGTPMTGSPVFCMRRRDGIYTYEFYRDPDAKPVAGWVLLEIAVNDRQWNKYGEPVGKTRVICGYRKRLVLGTWEEHQNKLFEREQKQLAVNAYDAALRSWQLKAGDALLRSLKVRGSEIKIADRYHSGDAILVTFEQLAHLLGITLPTKPTRG